MKVKITKYIEFKNIAFKFSNNFKLEDISNNIIISMLDNLEKKL